MTMGEIISYITTIIVVAMQTSMHRALLFVSVSSSKFKMTTSHIDELEDVDDDNLISFFLFK